MQTIYTTMSHYVSGTTGSRRTGTAWPVAELFLLSTAGTANEPSLLCALSVLGSLHDLGRVGLSGLSGVSGVSGVRSPGENPPGEPCRGVDGNEDEVATQRGVPTCERHKQAGGARWAAMAR